ncbi:MAG: hypothetical protein NT148_00715, partial [Candidatus Nealsonbacteria bacterium]|nr:hypothetical protein [Candidatus Nealsonbacteria bacterium]
KSKVYFYSIKEKSSNTENYLKAFKLFGEHNISNMMAAITVAEILEIPISDILKQIKTFKDVPHRQEFIKEIKGVKYFNDTSATMPDAAVEAIKTFKVRFAGSKIILIAGGQNKNLKFDKMIDEIKKKVDHLVLLPGTASDIIKEKLKGEYDIVKAESMKEAVLKAKELANKGDIVLLSPGATSFNLFKNEFDRGNQFIKEIRK